MAASIGFPSVAYERPLGIESDCRVDCSQGLHNTGKVWQLVWRRYRRSRNACHQRHSTGKAGFSPYIERWCQRTSRADDAQSEEKDVARQRLLPFRLDGRINAFQRAVKVYIDILTHTPQSTDSSPFPLRTRVPSRATPSPTATSAPSKAFRASIAKSVFFDIRA